MDKAKLKMNTKMLGWNRYIAWFFSIGYVVVHLASDIHHGQGLAAMSAPVRLFFIVSFVWIAVHVGVALRVFGIPLQLKSVRDFYHWDALGVLVVTVPIFSIPALGASPFWMAVAWVFFAPHLALNVWYLMSRSHNAIISRMEIRVIATAVYLSLIVYAAIRSFPTGHIH